MRNKFVGIRRLERSGLPSLLQGAQPEQFVQLGEWVRNRSTDPSGLTALWEVNDNDGVDFLPNALVGSNEALSDSIAWTGAFLQGLGPISALMRIISDGDLQAVINPPPPALHSGIETLSRCVSIIAGEVIARQGALATEESLTLEACSNTLAFAIYRAAYVAPYLEEDEVIRRWEVTFPQFDKRQNSISHTVIDLLRTSEIAFGYPAFPGHSYGDIADQLSFDALSSNNDMNRSVTEAVRNAVPEQFWQSGGNLGSEALVGVVDQAMPILLRMRNAPADDRASMIARLASLANKELQNQLELVSPALGTLPQIGVWLGRWFGENAPGKVMSLNKGMGWRVAINLFEKVDIVARPNYDISFLEWHLSMIRGAPQKRPTYKKIEIFPGHFIDHDTIMESRSNSVKADQLRNKNRARQSFEDDIISKMERSLRETLQGLQDLRGSR